MAVTTPQMGLLQPTINIDSGLVWEQAANANSAVIDQHNHTPGSGTQIPPSGLDIDTDLPFNNNSATILKSAVFQAQSSLSTLRAVYTIGNDLYYNDGASNVIRITSGGTVNATSSGISSGTASASFVSSVLVVNSASNTPANIQSGSILLGNNVSGSNFLTLSPPNAMATNYGITLPALPLVQSIMTLDQTGNMSAPYTVDNSTIVVASNVLKVPTGGINTLQLATASVTQTKLVPQLSQNPATLGNLAISNSCGAFTAPGNTGVHNVTNLAVQLVTSGRTVDVRIQPDGSNNSAQYLVPGSNAGHTLFILRNNVVIAQWAFTGATVSLLPPSFYIVDNPPTTTNVYLVQMQSNNGSVPNQMSYCVLTAIER